MPDGPFLLSEEEQEEENRAQLEAFGAAQLDALRGRPKPKAEPRPTQPRPQSRQPFATGVNPMMNHGASGAYHAAIGSAMQGRALGNMISQTMAAHQDENDSRVSQEREYRRMMHEQELERMRQETERMKVEALLKRLEMESGGGRTIRFPGGSITHV